MGPTNNDVIIDVASLFVANKYCVTVISSRWMWILAKFYVPKL